MTVVFFDVAGTLIRTRGGVGQQYAALARPFGVEADPEALARHFPAAFRAAPPMAFPGTPPQAIPDLEREVWRGLVRDVFTRAGLIGAFGAAGFARYFTTLFDHFARPEAWEVYPDVLPALEALRGRGCRLGVITNFDGRVLAILAGLGLATWFEGVTLSSRVGAVKPDRAIFDHALAHHGVAAGDAVHVGDSPETDIAGARAAGLGGVLIDREGRYRDPAAGVRAVRSLAHVVGIVSASGGQAPW